MDTNKIYRLLEYSLNIVYLWILSNTFLFDLLWILEPHRWCSELTPSFMLRDHTPGGTWGTIYSAWSQAQSAVSTAEAS